MLNTAKARSLTFIHKCNKIQQTFLFCNCTATVSCPSDCDLALFPSFNALLNSDFLGHFPDSHLGVNGKEDSDNSFAITRLFFIPGRTSATASTGEVLQTKQQLCNPYQP